MVTGTGMVTDEQRALLDAIGMLLLVRQYNRRVYPEQSGAAELSPTEFVFVSVFEFNRQVFINGFDGFVSNTDAEYADFLPVALAAVGAPRYALLARIAWERREPTEGQFDKRFFDAVRDEDLDALLLAYAERNRDALPDPALWTPEYHQQWERDKEKWWAQRWPQGARR